MLDWASHLSQIRGSDESACECQDLVMIINRNMVNWNTVMIVIHLVILVRNFGLQKLSGLGYGDLLSLCVGRRVATLEVFFAAGGFSQTDPSCWFEPLLRIA